MSNQPLKWAGAVVLLAMLSVPLCAICAGAEGKQLKKATFMPLWYPQAQFAGYYTALEKGIYRKHGIDVTILKGGPNSPSSEYLRTGKADFAALWLTTGIQERISGTKLVNLAQIVRQTSMMLIARKASGITAPAHLNGRKIGLWGGPFAIPPHIFFKNLGLQVREVPQSLTVNLFLRGGIEVASAMWYNEYHTIINSGLEPDELSIFLLKDYGINLPEDGLYTLERTLRRDPELAEKFVQASLEGWRYAFAHPEEALDIVLKHMRDARIPANRVHQRWMLERMRDLVMPEGVELTGKLQQKEYEEAGKLLIKHEIIPLLPPYREFTGAFR